MIARKLQRPAGLALLLMVLLMAFVSAHAIENDPIEFTIQVSPTKLTEPGEVNVSLRVANTGNEDMIAPVTLYDPAGKLVGSFGDGGSYRLSAGAFRTCEDTWLVTEEQLDAGEFAYTLKYHLQDENGELVEFSRQAVARVEFTGERVKLTINRTITPEVVRSGKSVTVVYDLYNSGNVELKDIKVKEQISKNSQTVKSLAPGEKETLTFTTKIGSADLTSSAAITYKAASTTKVLSAEVEDAPIILAKPGLKLEISSDAAGVNIGDAAKVKVTFINSGNITYSNVSVKDEKKGEFLTNITIPAGETVQLEKEFILTEPTTFKVTATLPDNTGNTNTMTSNELLIGVFDPDKAMLLTLNLTSDRTSVPQVPGQVQFALTVTNNSNIKAENIDILHGDTLIYTIPALEPGESTQIVRDYTISQAGKFRFTASLKDTMQNTVTFDSKEIQIVYARATSVPTVRPVPTLTVPPQATIAPAEPILHQAKDAVKVLLVVAGGVFAGLLVLFLASTGVRMYKKMNAASVYDHLELGERRNYTDPADEELDDVPVRTEQASLREEQQPLMPHEKLVRSTDDSAMGAPLPYNDGEGGYRVSRNAGEPKEEVHTILNNNETQAQAPAQPAAEEEEGARRRRTQPVQRMEDGE